MALIITPLIDLRRDIRWYLAWRAALPAPLQWAEAAAERAMALQPRLHDSFIWLGGTVSFCSSSGWHFDKGSVTSQNSALLHCCLVVNAQPSSEGDSWDSTSEPGGGGVGGQAGGALQARGAQHHRRGAGLHCGPCMQTCLYAAVQLTSSLQVGLVGKLVAPSWREALNTTAAVLASIAALAAMVTAIDTFWMATYMVGLGPVPLPVLNPVCGMRHTSTCLHRGAGGHGHRHRHLGWQHTWCELVLRLSALRVNMLHGKHSHMVFIAALVAMITAIDTFWMTVHLVRCTL